MYRHKQYLPQPFTIAEYILHFVSFYISITRASPPSLK